MMDITVCEGNILKVSIPMLPPLRQVNSYILPDKTGNVTIIDPGPRSPESEKAWEDALEGLGLSWSRIRNIVITHHHPDHYGLAGWMQARSGCLVWMSERAHAETKLVWGDSGGLNETLPVFFARHGMPECWTSQIREHLDSFLPQVSPQPEVSYVDTGVPFQMGDREWLPLVTGGHAPGHVSFYHEDSGHIICGDAVLPLISPNVSLLPGSDPEPLLTFMTDLRRLLNYKVSLAFPGHREPFSGFDARIRVLLLHHEERLEAVEALLSEGALTGYELCEELFRGRMNGIHQLRFAMSEALAHAAELVRQGRAEEFESGGGIIRYKLADRQG
jgi:glyoxylase-like metal-dependent hydrolase (beta-lactamase superfamily II)